MASPTDELATSVQGASVSWEGGRVVHRGAQINSKTRVRLLRAGCARYVAVSVTGFCWTCETQTLVLSN